MDRVGQLDALGRRAAAEQDALLAVSDLTEVRARVVAAMPRPRASRTRRLVWWSGGLAAAATVTLTLLAVLRGPETLQFTVGDRPEPGAVGQWVSAPSRQAIPIRFSDGTAMTLAPGSRGRVVSADVTGAHVVLENGRASVTVRPTTGSSWTFSTGPFSVQVTGTRFALAWSPDQDLLELNLYEGTLSVSGCVFGSGRPVLAGERLRAWCQRGRFEVDTVWAYGREPATGAPTETQPERTPPASSAVAAATEAATADAPQPGSGAAESPSWQQLARKGKYKQAFASASTGGFESQCQSAGASDLALLGDVARYAGRLKQASYAYQLLRNRFPGSGRAAVAAFTLGRMAFDQQGSYGQAARWFQVYLAEQPGGGLAREAQGRLMEAMYRTGDEVGARKIAARYLKRYPGGPHAPLARKLDRPKSRTNAKR